MRGGSRTRHASRRLPPRGTARGRRDGRRLPRRPRARGRRGRPQGPAAELSADETFRRRFVHEARAAGEVRHKHLVPITDAGEAEGRPYLAVAFVRGQTLEDRLASDGPLPMRGHGPGRRPRRVGAGRAARRGHRASRRQAVERDHRRDGVGQPDGLRAREGPRVHGAHQAGDGDGDARLPRARDAPRVRGDGRLRHLRARVPRLRVHRGPRAVRATSRCSTSRART